jgi:hypothetical protein
MAVMLSASRCHETTQREMRSAADLFASIEQLPGPPVRPPTDGPGLAKTQRSARCANDQADPSKKRCID